MPMMSDLTKRRAQRAEETVLSHLEYKNGTFPNREVDEDNICDTIADILLCAHTKGIDVGTIVQRAVDHATYEINNPNEMI